jgi:hypothetical protein
VYDCELGSFRPEEAVVPARPKPVILAAVTCDQAIREEGTGKWTLVGTFVKVHVLLRPGAKREDVPKIQHPKLAIYYCIGNAQGSYDFQVQVLRLQGEETTIARVEGKLDCGSDRLVANDFAINILNVVFPGFGRYVFRLVMDGVTVGEKPIDVVPLVAGTGEQK